MVRGINKTDIFKDEQGRVNFHFAMPIGEE
jgi:hypothetical protein